MNADELKEVLGKHLAWLKDRSGADLRGANLRGANLRGAHLRCADLRGANLSDANLSDANLSCADLSDADLRGADLRDANLSCADLSDADLRGANLSNANLSDANLSGANLSGANLSGANLSGCIGLLTARQWMSDNFQHDALGYIVYKAIGDTTYIPPTAWLITTGAYIEEVVNPLPTLECACGVNFAVEKWCLKNYPRSTLWRCRIRWEDLPDVVVPYNTNGKARCGRLELLEIVKEVSK